MCIIYTYYMCVYIYIYIYTRIAKRRAMRAARSLLYRSHRFATVASKGNDPDTKTIRARQDHQATHLPVFYYVLSLRLLLYTPSPSPQAWKLTVFFATLRKATCVQNSKIPIRSIHDYVVCISMASRAWSSMNPKNKKL